MSDNPTALPSIAGMTTPSGGLTTVGYAHIQSLGKTARFQTEALAALQAYEDFWGFTDRYPENGRNITIRKIPFAFEVISVTCKTSTGSCTITPKINSTTITSTNGSATTSETERNATAANVGAAGDDVVVTVSAVSSAEDLDVTIKYRRV